jgi:hypothetical protein
MHYTVLILRSESGWRLEVNGEGDTVAATFRVAVEMAGALARPLVLAGHAVDVIGCSEGGRCIVESHLPTW